MKDLKNKLLNLQDIIEKNKIKMANLQGKKQSALDRLKAELDFNDISEVEGMIQEKIDEKEKLESKIEEMFEEIEEKYDLEL